MNSATRQHFSVHLPAGLNPRELLNLRQMLEIYLPEYISVGGAFQSISDNLDVRFLPEDVLEDSRYEAVLKSLANIRGRCNEIGLGVCGRVAEAIYEEYKKAAPTYQKASQDIHILDLAFDAEVRERNFFFVPPERYRYFSSWGVADDGLGEKVAPFRPVIQSFPPAEQDVREAGNCIAFARYTAAVFHLMRVLEVGLKAIAKAQGITYERTFNWGDYIAGIEKRHPDPFLKEAMLYLRGVKNVWRNPTMHVEREYSQEEAERILQAVQAFMAHLASKLSE